MMCVVVLIASRQVITKSKRRLEMKYFTIAELCKSDTADRLGIDNRCKKEHVVNMTALVDNVLDPLR